MIETKSLPYAKEIGDVGVALSGLVSDIKAKKSVTEIVGGSLQNLIAAVDGVEKIDDEIAADPKVAFATMGYHSGEIAGALLPAKAPAAPSA